jgi:hypothetical protein
MITRFKTLVSRREPSLAEDAMGVVVLFVVLFAALALPGAA